MHDYIKMILIMQGSSQDLNMKHMVEKTTVGDIPNRYTSDVVLNQQARVAHQGWYGGFAIPGGPVAKAHTAVQDAGAYGGYLDRPMADPETGPWRNADD
jgi:hypothetical protein